MPKFDQNTLIFRWGRKFLSFLEEKDGFKTISNKPKFDFDSRSVCDTKSVGTLTERVRILDRLFPLNSKTCGNSHTISTALSIDKKRNTEL
uniref:Uncharacterized protein n=1 Tax=Leptospira ellisii TaxID=2023197 RepID=A0A2N0BBP0_9LEPT|nr:hypothetical protein CH379_05175 [Leptospira ellisii]